MVVICVCVSEEGLTGVSDDSLLRVQLHSLTMFDTVRETPRVEIALHHNPYQLPTSSVTKSINTHL